MLPWKTAEDTNRNSIRCEVSGWSAHAGVATLELGSGRYSARLKDLLPVVKLWLR